MANWIAGAIKHPGALTATAKKAGAVGKDGTINAAWLSQAAKKKGTVGRRARLAMTLKKMRRRKK